MESRDKLLRVFFYSGIGLLIVLAGAFAYSFFSPIFPGRPSYDEFGNNLAPELREKIIERIGKYEELTENEPNIGDHWLQLALSREQLGDFQGAIAANQKAAQYSAGSFLPFLNLGNLYTRLGQYDQAESSYDQAVKNDPVRVSLYRPYVELYSQYLTKKHSKAPELLTAALQLDALKENPELLGLLAVYYRDQGMRDEAIAAFRRLVRADPDNAAAREELEKLQQ